MPRPVGKNKGTITDVLKPSNLAASYYGLLDKTIAMHQHVCTLMQ